MLSAVAHAGSATWNLNPGSGDWNTASNWTPATVPNGMADMATFSASNTTNVFLSATTQVSGITFDSGASAYTITVNTIPELTISGAGISNSSGNIQNFVNAVTGLSFGRIAFFNSASAGTSTVFTNEGATVSGGAGGHTQFARTSTAGNAIITNDAATVPQDPNGLPFNGGITEFNENSTAGSAMITNNGATVAGDFNSGVTIFESDATAGNGTFTNNAATVLGGLGGMTRFTDNSIAGHGTFINNGLPGVQTDGGRTEFFAGSAGNGTFINNGNNADSAGTTLLFGLSTAGNGTFMNNGGTGSSGAGGATIFFDTSTAAAATLIAKGGSGGAQGGAIVFELDSTGGTSRVEIFGNGELEISVHHAPGVTIGSLEGSGNVLLGFNDLTVGSNNLSTTFSGVIQDGGEINRPGSLTKIGTGALALSGANTYAGSTTVSAGTLLVNNTSGSGTGSGAVQVNAGTLGGTGTIAGAVTVGTGSGPGAFLSPGLSPGTLTIQSALTLNSDATYQFELSSSTGGADKIVANGVTINGANFSFTDLGSGAIALGRAFIVIDDTALSAITGTFSNLADGSVFTVNGTTFQVSYEGGNGNDLTLTVVGTVPEPATWAMQGIGATMLMVFIRFHLRRKNSPNEY